MPEDFPILLFDGHCKLCSGLVQFILRHDSAGRIKMAALQSEAGRKLLDAESHKTVRPDSMVWIQGGHYYYESDAAQQLVRALGGWWRIFWIIRFFPRFVRDSVYRFIAGNRYRIWGKSRHCFLPRPEWEDRFL